MLTDVQKKWVAALRSGEYGQAQGYLRHVNADEKPKYCCLGVLTELAVQAGVIPDFNSGTNHHTNQIPCTEVADWAGLRTKWGAYFESSFIANPAHSTQPGDRSNTALTTANDTGKTFAEIADIIESEPEGLFVQAEKVNN